MQTKSYYPQKSSLKQYQFTSTDNAKLMDILKYK